MHVIVCTMWPPVRMFVLFTFFFTHPATTETYTLSLHDALPIYVGRLLLRGAGERLASFVRNARAHVISVEGGAQLGVEDRKSTRLNSSHANISYAVFCLKKKKRARR